MERFDKHIRTKLEERRVVPSEEAWNKITDGIPSEKKTKGAIKYVWAVAASFVGILLVSVLFYQKEQTHPEDSVVEKTNNEIVPQKETRVVEKTGTDDKDIKEIKESPFVIKAEEKPLKEVVFRTETPNEETKQPINDTTIAKPLDVISIKANEVFAQVEKLESLSPNRVTDEEVDSLLRVAQKEILTEKLFTQNGKVDAMALLTEVEDELDESFRDQIFEALKEGYLKLRTAVADRNK